MGIKVVKATQIKIMYEEEYTEHEFMKRKKETPFKTPDGYFDSIEDRIMGKINYESKKKSSPTKVLRLLKPVLGLAASFLLALLLVYHPINFSIKNMAETKNADTISNDWMNNYAFNISLVDENTLINAIFGDETPSVAQANPDEVLAYLSSDMTDLDIYSEIQK